jgi:hypothetical protein
MVKILKILLKAEVFHVKHLKFGFLNAECGISSLLKALFADAELFKDSI